MISIVLRSIGRVHLVLAGLALALVLCQSNAGRYGDRLQIALPIIAWGCAALNGHAGEFALRFTGMVVVAHASKRTLGETDINARPYGGSYGFPSAHTAAAAFGASSLVSDCLKGHPVAQALVTIGAAFVGASRIEVGAHDIWQVLAGGLLGWGADRVARRPDGIRRHLAPALLRFGHAARSAGGQAGAGLAARLGRTQRRLLRLLAVGVAAVAVMLPSLGRTETEISLYGGAQIAQPGTVTHSILGSQSVIWKGRSFEAPPYYGLRVTWWQTERLGWGVEMNHAKIYADDPASYGYDRLEFTDGMNLITLNLWRRWPGAISGSVTPYVGAGVGLVVLHVDVAPSGAARTFGYQVTGPAVQVVAGLSRPMGGRWSVFGEYKGTWSRHKAKLDSGGTLSTKVWTHAMNLGVSWRF